MQLNTVIFDMDGLLIDSEPFWAEAGAETLARYNIRLSEEQYHTSTGLRTREWIEWWFTAFSIDPKFWDEAEQTIIATAIEKIAKNAAPMEGVNYIFEFFKQRHFHIGLASSSPKALINVVIEKLQIGDFIEANTSAEFLKYGKPHPQVYLDCAALLNVQPTQCVCFEDSFNGLIAAKAARMKCVAIPDKHFAGQLRWNAADLTLSALTQFDEKKLQLLEGR